MSMKLSRKLLTYASFSVIPVVGGVINSAIATRYTKDFFDSLPYILIYTPIFIVSTTVPIFLYFKSFLYMYAALFYSLIIPFITSYAVSKKYENYIVEINDHYDFTPNDHYIEVILKMPVSYASGYSNIEEEQMVDLNSVFKKVFNKALKSKLRKSPYYPKLRFIELDKCSSLKVSISQNKMVLRKKCRDVIIEIVLNNNKNTEVANSPT